MLQSQARPLNRLEWYPLTRDYVARVPTAGGVYWLGAGGEVIYIGMSHNLRQRLPSHLATADPCIRLATVFAFDMDPNPEAREEAALRDYLRRYRRLPRCNDRRR
jgi:predicted GIY-YIG superfamily endonuclease